MKVVGSIFCIIYILLMTSSFLYAGDVEVAVTEGYEFGTKTPGADCETGGDKFLEECKKSADNADNDLYCIVLVVQFELSCAEAKKDKVRGTNSLPRLIKEAKELDEGR
jgi:hypothetical protein